MNIVLVDDNKTVHAYINALLRKELNDRSKYKILFYNDSVKFVKDYENKNIEVDLLILDWHMPQISGLDVLEIMHQSREDITPPTTILFTGNIYIDSEIQNSYTFLKSIITKPVSDNTISKFLEIIKK